jgi:NADPH:quinone reductase-like Zn-dependent oxidoreductase
MVSRKYGDLSLEEVEQPELAADGVLIRVRASSVNPVDYHQFRGTPHWGRVLMGLRRPKNSRLGADVAGTVEAVGANVSQLRPGDDVFGSCSSRGAFAEYVQAADGNLIAKPAGLTFAQAAAIPVAGVTALQALRDSGGIQSAQRVLINGAAGGVGTFAVQIAKGFGAHVTGVCSTRNVELVRSLGADRVVDYTAADFTRDGEQYDLIVNAAGSRSLRDLRRALAPDGTLVLVALRGMLGGLVLRRFVRHKLVPFVAGVTKERLELLVELIEAGKVTPVVDRTYSLGELPEAIRYLETHRARGKVVITV